MSFSRLSTENDSGFAFGNARRSLLRPGHPEERPVDMDAAFSSDRNSRLLNRFNDTPLKSVEQGVADLQAAAQRHKFGVLHIPNLHETLAKKGVDLPNACQILEICNPKKAKEVLSEDMDLNVALPCRVLVKLYFRFPVLGPTWVCLERTE